MTSTTSHIDQFYKELQAPLLLPDRAKHALFLASHLGSVGLQAYQNTFEKGTTEKFNSNLIVWKHQQKETSEYGSVEFHSGKIPISKEAWKEATAFISFENSGEDARDLFWKEPILAEMKASLAHVNDLSTKDVASLYMALFQPTLEQLISDILPKERDSVKRTLLQIRKKELYRKEKANASLLETIFSNMK